MCIVILTCATRLNNTGHNSWQTFDISRFALWQCWCCNDIYSIVFLCNFLFINVYAALLRVYLLHFAFYFHKTILLSFVCGTVQSEQCAPPLINAIKMHVHTSSGYFIRRKTIDDTQVETMRIRWSETHRSICIFSTSSLSLNIARWWMWSVVTYSHRTHFSPAECLLTI